MVKVEKRSYTFPALVYREKLPKSESYYYTLILPDLRAVTSGQTLVETIHNGKTLLKDTLEVFLKERLNDIGNEAYFKHPSQSEEEAKERCIEFLSELYEDEDIKEVTEFVKYTDITTAV